MGQLLKVVAPLNASHGMELFVVATMFDLDGTLLYALSKDKKHANLPSFALEHFAEAIIKEDELEPVINNLWQRFKWWLVKDIQRAKRVVNEDVAKSAHTHHPVELPPTVERK